MKCRQPVDEGADDRVSCATKGDLYMENGRIHIYCGDGKGKTTAAVGLAVRASGSGKKVLFLQFLKGEESGERQALRLLPGVTVYPNPEHIKFSFQMTEAEKDEVRAANDHRFKDAAIEAIEKGCDLLILDEAIGALQTGLLSRALVLFYLRTKPKGLEIVLTGRDPDQELMELADYISEVKKLRHPFDQGEQARQGIEW